MNAYETLGRAVMHVLLKHENVYLDAHQPTEDGDQYSIGYYDKFGCGEDLAVRRSTEGILIFCQEYLEAEAVSEGRAGIHDYRCIKGV
jgi:hypothetical protein